LSLPPGIGEVACDDIEEIVKVMKQGVPAEVILKDPMEARGEEIEEVR
jgi:predicted amino acid racemase